MRVNGKDGAGYDLLGPEEWKQAWQAAMPYERGHDARCIAGALGYLCIVSGGIHRVCVRADYLPTLRSELEVASAAVRE